MNRDYTRLQSIAAGLAIRYRAFHYTFTVAPSRWRPGYWLIHCA